jgi:hypothetical protein
MIFYYTCFDGQEYFRYTASDRGNSGYVPGAMSERVSLVWPLTFFNGLSAASPPV